MEEQKMEKHRFVIKIKGFATYNADSLRTIKGTTAVKNFNEEVEKLLSEYYVEIKNKLDELIPVKINPVIDGEFYFDGVEDEARE